MSIAEISITKFEVNSDFKVLVLHAPKHECIPLDAFGKCITVRNTYEIGSNILWKNSVLTYVAKYLAIDPIIQGAPRWTAEEMNMTKTAWQEVGMISESNKCIPSRYIHDENNLLEIIWILFKIFLPTEMAPDYSGVWFLCLHTCQLSQFHIWFEEIDFTWQNQILRKMTMDLLLTHHSSCWQNQQWIFWAITSDLSLDGSIFVQLLQHQRGECASNPGRNWQSHWDPGGFRKSIHLFLQICSVVILVVAFVVFLLVGTGNMTDIHVDMAFISSC